MKPQYKLGMLTSYLGFVISTVSGFVLPPLIIAKLGQELNGLYDTLTSFSLYFGMMDLGLGTCIIRYVAKFRAEGEKEKIARFLYVMRSLYFMICIFTFILGCVFCYFIPIVFKASIPIGYEEKARIVFILSLLTIILTIFDNLYYSTIKAYEQFFVSRSSAIMKVIVRIILIVLFLQLGFSIVAIAFSDCFSTLIILLFRMAYMKGRLSIYYQKPIKDEIRIKEIFGYSAYVIIYSLAEKIFWQLDKVVLGIISGGVSVTIYAIGSQISSGISSVSSTVSSMYLPHAVRTSTNNVNYTSVMAQMARFQLFVILPVFLGFAVFGKCFFLLWVGEGYDESYKIAIVLIVTLIPVLLQSYGEALLKAINKQKVFASAMAVSVIANIALTILLVRQWGAFGAALASAIVNMLRCLFMSFYYQSTLKIEIVSFLKLTFYNMTPCIFISTVVGLALLYLLKPNKWMSLLVDILAFGTVYFLSVYYWSFNDYELTMARGMIRKIFRKRT